MGTPQIGMNANGEYQINLSYNEIENDGIPEVAQAGTYLTLTFKNSENEIRTFDIKVANDGLVELVENDGEFKLIVWDSTYMPVATFELDFNSEEIAGVLGLDWGIAYISGLGDVDTLSTEQNLGILYVKKLTNTEILDTSSPGIDPSLPIITNYSTLTSGDNIVNNQNTSYWYIPTYATGVLFTYDVTGYKTDEDYENDISTTINGCEYKVESLSEDSSYGEFYNVNGVKCRRYTGPNVDQCISNAGLKYQGYFKEESVSGAIEVYYPIYVEN